MRPGHGPTSTSLPSDLPPRRGGVVRTVPPARRGGPRRRPRRDGADRRTERCRQDQPAPGLRRDWCPWRRGGSGCSAWIRSASATRCAGVSGCSPTPPISTTISRVRENVRFAVRAAGADTGRIDDACDRLGLTGRLLKTSASKLSAGQRRRVALAVLAARWPELWLLDEPHAGLDASARETLNQLVAEAAGSGVTVVIASHEADFVESLATRAVVVTGGRVTAERSIGGTGEAAASVGARARSGHRPARHRAAAGGAGGPCGVTPCWWPARTSASRPGPGWRCPRWRPSASWPWACSPSPSGPIGP